ncbi:MULTISPECIES: glycosyltransferase [Bacteria]|uniref:glycosyltransferase n=1 Tax=Bacteria TaxID=2 RepID=UPI003C7D342F
MAQLRVVLDQLGPSSTSDLADASRALVSALAVTAPQGCTLEAIVPSGTAEPIEGVSSVRRLPLARRELAAAWQLGVTAGVGGGMIHSPTPLAPLVRHDRFNDHDQTVPTFWDLRAWEAPHLLPKGVVAGHRAMLRRAARHADAVVVPSHAIAERLSDLAPLGDRIRVIAGAPDPEIAAPLDAAARRRALGLPERYAAVSICAEQWPDGLAAALAVVVAAGADVVILDADEDGEHAVAARAVAAGLPAARVHVRGRQETPDRAALLGGAAVVLVADQTASWPWRAGEAMSLGIPVVAIDSAVHRDVIADGGRIVAEEDLAVAVEDALGDGASRLAVLSADRSRAFSWPSAAEHVWALHADL